MHQHRTKLNIQQCAIKFFRFMIFYKISVCSQLRGMRELRSEHIHVQIHVAAKSIGVLLWI